MQSHGKILLSALAVLLVSSVASAEVKCVAFGDGKQNCSGDGTARAATFNNGTPKTQITVDGDTAEVLFNQLTLPVTQESGAEKKAAAGIECYKIPAGDQTEFYCDLVFSARGTLRKL